MLVLFKYSNIIILHSTVGFINSMQLSTEQAHFNSWSYDYFDSLTADIHLLSHNYRHFSVVSCNPLVFTHQLLKAFVFKRKSVNRGLISNLMIVTVYRQHELQQTTNCEDKHSKCLIMVIQSHLSVLLPCTAKQCEPING